MRGIKTFIPPLLPHPLCVFDPAFEVKNTDSDSDCDFASNVKFDFLYDPDI